MKKQMMDYVKTLGGDSNFSGKWPQTLFVYSFTAGVSKQDLIDAMIKRFGRHTQIKFV